MDSRESALSATPTENVGQAIAIAMNAVPIAGGVLSDMAAVFISRRQNRRLEGFILSLSDDLRALESKLNKDFLCSDHFKDLAEDIFSKAAETRQEEKLDAFRAIFTNTITNQKPRYDEAVEVAELVFGWQPRHIVLLKLLADPQAADKQMGNVVGRGGGLFTTLSDILRKLLPDWTEDQIDRTWSDLYDKKIHRTENIKTMMTDQGIFHLCGRLTSFGEKIAGYLEIRPVGPQD